MYIKSIFMACAMLGTVTCAYAQATTVTWSTLGNDSTGYVQRFVVKGDMSMDKLAFNMLPRKMTPVNKGDKLIELMPGYYAIQSKRFRQGADSVVIDLRLNNAFSSCSYAPDGVHRIERDGTTRPVTYTRKQLTERRQWATPGKADRMPYGEEIFDLNASIAGANMGIYDVVPSYKKVTLTSGMSRKPSQVVIEEVATMDPEAYRIIISDDAAIVQAKDKRTAQCAFDSFKNLVLDGAPDMIPNVIIDDYPDFPYRGLMIDVSRNFQTMPTLKKIIDEMAAYRLNTLHLHLVDDEAWRIEIPKLPELTEFAGRRGYTPNESGCIYQIYSGDGNPNSTTGVSNGYYTRDEFIDFLRYADSRGICVIPEIESPGHARAAIKAMEYRYRKTGDGTYRLVHDGDKSSFTSAQAYHDNVMNPALEGTYRFLDVVYDAIKDMYEQAGVPLPAIHIGGDEVARGAWDSSKEAKKLMAEKNLTTQTALHGYFVERIANMLNDKGIPMSGWQEIALGHTPEYNEAMAPIAYSVNCWTTSSADPEKSVNARALKAGFPVVLSNVNHFYMDLCYNHHPEEPGLKWGGVVDEFQSLHGYPAQLCPVDPATTKGNVIGLSGQLFAETLRSPEMLEMYLHPKMLGLAERAWNSDTTYTNAEFNAVIAQREMPRWSRNNINFHLRQPGIKLIDGEVVMNSPYAGAEIRYTTDGSEPTASSKLYTAPIHVSGDDWQVRARLYYQGKESLTTYYGPYFNHF